MTIQEVKALLRGGKAFEPACTYNGIGADPRHRQLRVVVVMVLMGANPNVLGGQHQKAHSLHNQVSRFGMYQNGPVLVIVINHKKSDIEQPANHTGREPCQERDAGKKAERHNAGDQDQRDQEFVPAPGTVLTYKLLAECKCLLCRPHG